MGRKKVQMKRIEDKHSRHVTFSKRRSGLMKKAHELSVLCDVELALIVFSGNGRLYEFCSSESLRKTLERYQKYGNKEESTNEPKEHHAECSGLWQVGDLLKVISNLKVEELTTKELTYVERELDTILGETRLRKTQLMIETLTALTEQEKQLREEKDFLEKKIEAMNGLKSNNDVDRGKELQLIELNDNNRGKELQLIEQNDIHGGSSIYRMLQLW